MFMPETDLITYRIPIDLVLAPKAARLPLYTVEEID